MTRRNGRHRRPQTATKRTGCELRQPVTQGQRLRHKLSQKHCHYRGVMRHRDVEAVMVIEGLDNG